MIAEKEREKEREKETYGKSETGKTPVRGGEIDRAEGASSRAKARGGSSAS